VHPSGEDWARFGQIQQGMMSDPEMHALMVEGGKIASWQTYISRTIPDL